MGFSPLKLPPQRQPAFSDAPGIKTRSIKFLPDVSRWPGPGGELSRNFSSLIIEMSADCGSGLPANSSAKGTFGGRAVRSLMQPSEAMAESMTYRAPSESALPPLSAVLKSSGAR